MRRLLVISPHADDETLGAYGFVDNWIKQGNDAYWLNVSTMKEEYGFSFNQVTNRFEEIEKVKNLTGYKEIINLGLKPAGLKEYSENKIISSIKEVFEKIKPEIVILPYPFDAHSDHKVVYDCAIACTKTFRAPYVKKILCMEILSETNFASKVFNPNLFVGITEEQLTKKIDIMSVYSSEIKPPPFPRSKEAIKSQACFRGSACNQTYAEAFLIVKEII